MLTMKQKDTNQNLRKLKCADLYDPSHPEADWSGFVPRRSSKKHIPTPPVQVTTIDGNGIGPSENSRTEEWTKPARKIVGHKESGAVSGCNAVVADQIHNSSTFSLIGGPIPGNDPSSMGPSRWETEAQVAARRKSTDLCQLTDNGRSMQVRGRKRKSDISNQKLKTFCPKRDNTGDNQMNIEKTNADPMDLVGFRAHTHGRSSFLDGLGSEIAKTTNEATKFVSTTPYATDGNLPTDPYCINANGDRRKDLLLENFSSVVPGYSGKRTFID